MQFDLGGEVRRDGSAKKTELTAEFQVLSYLCMLDLLASKMSPAENQSHPATECLAVTCGNRPKDRDGTVD